MSKYQSHRNPLYIRCHECHKDITLKAQYYLDSIILCGECNELADDTGELEIISDDYDSNS